MCVFIRPNTLLLCIFLCCIYFSCTAQIRQLKFKSEYYLRINIGNHVKKANTGSNLGFLKNDYSVSYQWNTALMETAVVSKECEHRQSHFNFLKNDYSVSLFLEKQLASQNIFLVKSKLSITMNLFLVFYKSTFL